MFRKTIALFLSFTLLFLQSGMAQSAAELNMPGFFKQMHNSFMPDKFRPLHLRYFSYDIGSDNFRILIDKGDAKNLEGPELKNSSQALLNYFLIGVTLPDDKFWVNLRPDSENSIIDSELAKTDVGKIFLEADLQLKKDTARFTSPETAEGKAYWDTLYKKAQDLFGSENISIPTLTRPWIVPNEIIIRETKDSAYVYKATLKVLLEQDHLKDSAVYNFKDPRLQALNEYSSQVIRETIIPKLTKEVNISKRYAPLRQVFYSLILARWFKTRFSGKPGVYSNLINSNDLTKLTSQMSWSTTTYFKQYQQSFKDGEYNIQEPAYTPFGRTIRSYFSGGLDVTGNLAATAATPRAPTLPQDVNPGAFTGDSTRDLARLLASKGTVVGLEGKAGEGALQPLSAAGQNARVSFAKQPGKAGDSDSAAQVAQVRTQVANLKNDFSAKHRIQPVLTQTLKLLDEGKYRQAWETLERALDIATRDYNVYGLTKFVAILKLVDRDEMVQLILAKRAKIELEDLLREIKRHPDSYTLEEVADATASAYGVMQQAAEAERRLAEIKANSNQASAPMRDYYKPIQVILDIRLALGDVLEQSGQSLFSPKNERDILNEAADIVRRYGGEPDRYDPETLRPEQVTNYGFTRTNLSMQGFIQDEYKGAGHPLTPETLAHIEKVLDMLVIINRKPRLTAKAAVAYNALQEGRLDAEIALLEKGEPLPSPYKTESDRIVEETRKAVPGLLRMPRDAFLDKMIDGHRNPNAPKAQEINDIDLLHEIARLALAGASFSGTMEELGERLQSLFTPSTVDIMLSMVKFDSGNIIMDMEGIQLVFSTYDSLEQGAPEVGDGVSFAKQVGNDISLGGVLSPAVIALIDASQPVEDMQGVAFGGTRVNFRVLDPQAHQDVLFEADGALKSAMGLQRQGENVVTIFATVKLMEFLRNNPKAREALIQHEILDTGEEAAHRRAWQQVKKDNPEGMMQYLTFIIDNMVPVDLLSLISEYENDANGRGEGRIKSGEWDKFEEAIYTHCKDRISKVIPNNLDDLVQLFGNKRMIHAVFGSEQMLADAARTGMKLNSDIIEALAKAWDADRFVVEARLICAFHVKEQLDTIAAANDKVLKDFEAKLTAAVGEATARKILDELAKETHQAWLDTVRGPKFVPYNKAIQDFLLQHLQDGTLAIRGITADFLSNPKKKTRIKKGDIKFSDLAVEQAFWALINRSPSEFADNEVLFNTVAGEWKDLYDWSDARNKFLYGLQANNVCAIINALRDTRLVERLTRGTVEERQQAIVDILRKINAGWRPYNPWGGFTDRLIHKPFGLEEDGGIGLDDINKDFVVLKAILRVLLKHSAEVQASLGEAATQAINTAFANGLEGVLDGLSNRDTLREAVRVNTQRAPGNRKISFAKLIGEGRIRVSYAKAPGSSAPSKGVPETVIATVGSPATIDDITKTMAGILIGYRPDGASVAARVLGELKEAGVAEKFFILMKEPNMLRHYESFIDFYKEQRESLEKMTPEQVRQRFIDQFETVVIYRADLYSPELLKEIKKSGILSKNLKGSGMLKRAAEIIGRIGIRQAVKGAMDEADVSSSGGEVLYDGRRERLYLSVSIVDPKAKDQGLANKKAEALARQVASYYARFPLILRPEVVGAGESDDILRSKILRVYEGKKIMVVKAQVSRFYLIEQLGHGKVLQADGVLKEGLPWDTESKMIPLQLEPGKVTASVDQLKDPWYEGLLDYIPPSNIESVTLYPLGEGIGYSLSSEFKNDGEKDEKVKTLEKYIIGVSENGNPLPEMDWKTEGEVVVASGELRQAAPLYSDLDRWAAFQELRPFGGLDYEFISNGQVDLALFLKQLQEIEPGRQLEWLEGIVKGIDVFIGQRPVDSLSPEQRDKLFSFRDLIENEKGFPEALISYLEQLNTVLNKEFSITKLYGEEIYKTLDRWASEHIPPSIRDKIRLEQTNWWDREYSEKGIVKFKAFLAKGAQRIAEETLTETFKDGSTWKPTQWYNIPGGKEIPMFGDPRHEWSEGQERYVKEYTVQATAELKNRLLGRGYSQGLVGSILAQVELKHNYATSCWEFKLKKASAPIGRSTGQTTDKLGGIDFRTMNILVQPMGNFAGLDFTLPKLNNLPSINLDEEFGQIQKMVAGGIIPSGMRIKELIAACAEEQEMNSRADEMLLCLADIFRLEEENLAESSPELKEALVIIDSNRFVLQ